MLCLTEKVVQRDWNLLCFTWKTLASPRCSCHLYFWRQAYVLHLCVCLFLHLHHFLLYIIQKPEAVCLVLCLNPRNSKTVRSLFFKQSFSKRSISCVSSRYGLRQLSSNDKPVPSILRCSELALFISFSSIIIDINIITLCLLCFYVAVVNVRSCILINFLLYFLNSQFNFICYIRYRLIFLSQGL